MSTKHTVIPRTGSIIINGNNILLIKYGPSKGKMEGRYNRVGGHIEYGEGILESAKREIQEETGLELDTKLVAICHVSGFFGKNIMNYITYSESDNTSFVDSDEGTLHRIDIDKLDTIKLFEDVKLILDIVLQDTSSTIYSIKAEFDETGNMKTFKVE